VNEGANKKKINKPHQVDTYVGKKLRAKRTIIGMSQEDLGRLVGVSFQQIQKYEKGLNRVGASRLYEISKILNTSISYFFEYIETPLVNGQGLSTSLSEDAAKFQYDNITNKEVLNLVRSYTKIKNTLIRRKIMSLIRSLSSIDESEGNDKA
jgi:transcriptional regulator with XRE-family HTH domain